MATDSDRGDTRATVTVARGANLVIALAKIVGGVISGSAALLSEAAHSVADSLNEVFLLAALSSRRRADAVHPSGYGKERFCWSLLAAVGIFVTGASFSAYQGWQALTAPVDTDESFPVVYTVLGVALVAESASLAKALRQIQRARPRPQPLPACPAPRPARPDRAHGDRGRRDGRRRQPATPAGPDPGWSWCSDVVVHGELVRGGAQRDGVDLVVALPGSPGVDQVGGEHPALEQVVVVGF